jgi:hypothetical protein
VPPGSGLLRTANGVTSFGSRRVVQVRDDLSAAQRVATTTHELAHIRCGHVTAALSGGQLHRGRAETEAESIAHVVCAALGFDTRGYSDAYVLGWARGDMDLIRGCADMVHRVAGGILRDLTPDDVTDDPTDGGDPAGPSAAVPADAPAQASAGDTAGDVPGEGRPAVLVAAGAEATR